MSINPEHVNKLHGTNTTNTEPLTDDELETKIATNEDEKPPAAEDEKPPAAEDGKKPKDKKPPAPPPKSDLEIALESGAINEPQYKLLLNPPDYIKNYLKNRTHVDATKAEESKEEPESKEEEPKEKSEEEIQKEEEEKKKPWGKDASDNYITGYDMSVDYKEKILQLAPEHIENVLCETDLSARYKYDLFKPDPYDGRSIISKITSNIPMPDTKLVLKLLSKLPIPASVLAKALSIAGPIMKVAAEAAKDGFPEKVAGVLADNVKSSLNNFIKKHDKSKLTGGGQFFTKQECSFF